MVYKGGEHKQESNGMLLPVWDTSSDTTVVRDNRYKDRCYVP